MENLIERYLKHYLQSESIQISYYNVDGAVCTVVVYTDFAQHNKATFNINIWNMLTFIYNARD